MQQFSVRTVVLVATLCAAATTIHAQQSSCRDARDNGGVSVDGDQTIRLTLGGRTVTLFCYMMGPDVNQTEAPYAYITLNQPNTAELITSHSTDPEGIRRVRTTFTKVRVDEATGKVHTGDFTFATTTIDDIDLTMLAISNACNPGCQRIGVSCPAPQDGLYNALGVPFGMSGVCTATTDSCTFPATAPPDRNSATATIDLSGTGFRLKDTMTIDSQFVYLDELATVKQPPPSTQVTVGNRRFGANSNVTTTSNSGLTSIVTLGVRPDAGRKLRDAIANLDFELTGNPNDCVVNARLAAPFCDFAMHYGWFSDIAALGLDVSMPALDGTCPGAFSWPSQFTAVGPSMSDRLTDIVSGGFGVCLCLDDGTGCGDGNCTWGIASDSGDTAGFQQNFYTLATATRCDSSTQYEISAFTDTNDTVCAALTVCLPGQYVSVRPSRTSNRECLRCTNGFTVANNNRTCQLWDVCAAGQYVLNRPTSSSDRTCGDCVNGTNFTAQPNENACAPVVNCDAGQSVSVQPSVSNNRECTDCVSAYSTAENAAGCTDWTPCEEVFNRCDVFDTNYNGGVCDCDGSAANSLGCPTTVEYTEPSATSDRVCTGCPAEAFYDSVGALCVQLTAECDANQGLLERAAPTTTSDRECDTRGPSLSPTEGPTTSTPTSTPSSIPTSSAGGGDSDGSSGSGDGSADDGSMIIVIIIIIVAFVAVGIGIGLVIRKRSNGRKGAETAEWTASNIKPANGTTAADLSGTRSRGPAVVANTSFGMSLPPPAAQSAPGAPQLPTSLPPDQAGGGGVTYFEAQKRPGPNYSVAQSGDSGQLIYDSAMGSDVGSKPLDQGLYSLPTKKVHPADVIYSDMDLNSTTPGLVGYQGAAADQVLYTDVNTAPAPPANNNTYSTAALAEDHTYSTVTTRDGSGSPC